MTVQGGNAWRVLVADSDYRDTIPQVEREFDALELVCPRDASELGSLVSDGFDALVVAKATLNRDLLERLAGIRLVVKMGRSYYNIDVDALRDQGIKFILVPRKGPNCVAELAMTFILALSKDLLTSHRSVVGGAYRLRGLRPERTSQRKMAFHWMHNTRIHEVRGKTLGIIGMGEIGTELARRANAMGMDIIYYKRHRLSTELEDRSSAQYRGLGALLEESDYVCLTVPHTPDTDKMVGADELALMRGDAYLVNICRGGVVDEHAVVNALRQGSIAGAALDVFTFEPLPHDSPLCQLDNVLLTPHIGGGTGTSAQLELTDTLREVVRVLSGGVPEVEVS